jgi:hypothetical protein
MRRYNENDIVKIVKENDRYENQLGTIVEVFELVHAPVTIFIVQFENGRKGYYFPSEMQHQ